MGGTTPSNKKDIIPKRLFKKQTHKKVISHDERNEKHMINKDVEEINLEILLVNTLTITATKVQTVVEEFMQEETYTSIFCFTETKVDNPNFKPIGLKIFTKQRRNREKKGGGLKIGYKDDKKQ